MVATGKRVWSNRESSSVTDLADNFWSRDAEPKRRTTAATTIAGDSVAIRSILQPNFHSRRNMDKSSTNATIAGTIAARLHRLWASSTIYWIIRAGKIRALAA